jgi:gliding motility-associated lipoprotein GldH
MKSNTRLITICVLLFLLNSCRQIDVYEKSIPISHHSWKHNYTCNGSFIINDTLAYYNVYIIIRHTDSYKYNNIWLNVGFQSPGDQMNFQKQNLTLSDDANGWYGSGMNDIWEVRKLLNDKPRRFRKNGEYHFLLENLMRDNPLDGVMSAGLRVEKVVAQ